MGRFCSSTIRARVPGGRTFKVFKNSITEPLSYSLRFTKLLLIVCASPACARIDSRIVVYLP